MLSQRPIIVSFSGIDGAGKSTQIDALCQHLQGLGFRPRIYQFWDDVVVLSGFRERIAHKAFKGDQGVGSPENPLVRRDKNVKSWYVTAFRLFLYVLDAVSLRGAVFKRRLRSTKDGIDAVIFDRYLYDELANLPFQGGPALQSWLMRLYLRMVILVAPSPDLALVVDADPEAAYLRKPEYPLEFVRANRDAFLSLSRIVPEITVVPPASAAKQSQIIMSLVNPKCQLRATPNAQLPPEIVSRQANTGHL